MTTKVEDAAPTVSDSTSTLVRQVNALIARDMSGNKEIGPMVSYSRLYTFATPADKLLMYTGWTCAMITGCGMPSFVFLIGIVIDSFSPSTTPADTLRTISLMSLIFTVVGVGVWITSLIMYSFLLLFSERVVKATRTKYLHSILRQESAWFDTINQSELSARLSKETSAMQRALGEKMGTIILAYAMCVAGLTFAFTKGWSFSLVLLVVFPFLGITTGLMAKVMSAGSHANMKAYGQSAGYAD